MYTVPVSMSVNFYRNELCSDSNEEGIGNNSELRDDGKNVEPGADVLSTLGYRTTKNGGELVSIQPDLDPVVDESKERSKRERHNKYGNETVLDDYCE